MSQEKNRITITKHNGERVIFDPGKLKKALYRAGADENQANTVTGEVTDMITDGMSTKKIYQAAYRILKKLSKRTAGRYKLKQAVQDMGPSGYPFEKFIGKLLEFHGYKTKVGEIVQGRCVTHEVDVIARNSKEMIMGECKFHRAAGFKSDVKVPLYIHSRFNDVKNAWERKPGLANLRFVGMIATNTRFSQDAIDYARCSGLRMLSWDYPEGDSLKDWIDQSGFHPITSLSTLRKADMQKLMENGLILCRELAGNQNMLMEMGLRPQQSRRILKEAEDLIR